MRLAISLLGIVIGTVLQGVRAQGHVLPAARASSEGGTQRSPSTGTLAAWAAMFESRGPTHLGTPLLLGKDAPLLGKVSPIVLRGSGYDFGIVITTRRALPSEILVPWPSTGLVVHVDLSTVVNTFVVRLDSTGVGMLNIAFPSDAKMLGTTLAWQALVFRMSFGEVGGTNLLLGNLGNQTSNGAAAYEEVFRGGASRGRSIRNAWEQPKPVYINAAGSHFLTLRGRYEAGSGPVEIRTGDFNTTSGLLLGVIPASPADFEITVFVPPGLIESPAFLYVINRLGGDFVHLSWMLARTPNL